ncbi:hypothetical protein [Nannocystis sp. SCPEA4]|uniref:hypothetical protein n=1 Tax=Nannocystis sp. SCPEA4 TaxID=2996787 RepID=UPI00226EB70C|nr:hypothetical protein [Nannocystis sp. SCPEA4]MCY1062745.1 hypothetical protein [Nannocystis sp. SCPEA4]
MATASRSSGSSTRRAPLRAVASVLLLLTGGAVALAGCTGGATATKPGDKETAPKQPEAAKTTTYAPPPPDAKPDVKPQPEPQPQPETKPEPEPRPLPPPPT